MRKAHFLKLLFIFVLSVASVNLYQAEVEAAPAEAGLQAELSSTVFVHTTSSTNTNSQITTLDHPQLNNNPDAIIHVTPRWNLNSVEGVYNDNPVGVYYFGSQWHLFNENLVPMPLNAHFNVFVASPLDTAYVHIHEDDNEGYGYNETFLEHHRLDGNPNEIVFATHNWNPHNVYNANTTYVGYHPTLGGWAIFKEQTDEFNPMPEDSAFNVLIPADYHDTFVAEASAENVSFNSLILDHPRLNNNPDAIFFADAFWDDGLARYQYNTRANIGVWYSGQLGRWHIYTQDFSSIQLESKFHVLIPAEVSNTEQTLSVNPASGKPGSTVTLTGRGYNLGGYVGTIRWDGVDVVGFEISEGGSFSTSFQIPAGSSAGNHVITVCSLSPCATGEFEQLASTNFEVLPDNPTGEPTYTIFLPIVMGDGEGTTPIQPANIRVEVDIDSTVEPVADSLPAFEEGGAPRPLGAMMDENGTVATFVQNEIFVETNDMGLVNDIIAKYSGEILLEIDPSESGIEDLPKMFLIQIDPTAGNIGELADMLAELDESDTIHSDVTFSSNAAAGLMAIAGEEALNGAVIGVNWVGEPNDPPDTAREALTGPSFDGAGYSPNPYNWSFMNRGSVQDIGTADAWNVLIYGGKWDNRVKYAVLDKGFARNADTPDGSSFQSIFPWANADGGRGDNRSPWHGIHVMQTAMAEADNNFGVAGVAHTVAEPINIYTGYDYVTSIASVLLARANGAKVINMSYSAEVPAVVSFTVLPFQHTTMAVRASGVLLFASAGNDGQNVDAERCIVRCWERTWHTPCENNGVICVGGLEWNSKMRAFNSNYGTDGGVHIFAPYHVYRGADPDFPGDGNAVRFISGTSFSSPYAGGVAALIWAADPSLSAEQVWQIMHNTAHTSPDGNVPRYVNAYSAVRSAVGESISATITQPSINTTVQQNSNAVFWADLGAVVDSATTLNATWTSSLDGTLDSESWTAPAGYNGQELIFTTTDLSLGVHTITLRLTGDGMTAVDTVQVTVENNPPTAEIDFPVANAEFCVGEQVNFSGSSFDPNQLSGIPESGYSWRSDRDGSLGTGNPRSVTSLTVGSHLITLTVTDDGGLTQTDTVRITILSNSDPDCFNRKPTGVITDPANNSSFDADEQAASGIWYKRLTLTGQIGDTEDGIGDLTVEWIDSVDGVLGTGTVNTVTGVVSITHNFTAEGCGTSHSVTLRVTDSGGKVNDIVPYTIFVSLLC